MREAGRRQSHRPLLGRGRLDAGKLHPAAGLGQFGNPQMAFDRARRDMQNDAVTARLAVYPADLTLAPNMRIEALGADWLGLAATQWRVAQVEHHHDGRGGSATSLDLSLCQGDLQRVTT